MTDSGRHTADSQTGLKFILLPLGTTESGTQAGMTIKSACTGAAKFLEPSCPRAGVTSLCYPLLPLHHASLPSGSRTGFDNKRNNWNSAWFVVMCCLLKLQHLFYFLLPFCKVLMTPKLPRSSELRYAPASLTLRQLNQPGFFCLFVCFDLLFFFFSPVPA